MSTRRQANRRRNSEPRHGLSIREAIDEVVRPRVGQERDQFIAAMMRADGQLVPIRDAVLALATMQDLERHGLTVTARNAARARLRAALSDESHCHP